MQYRRLLWYTLLFLVLLVFSAVVLLLLFWLAIKALARNF